MKIIKVDFRALLGYWLFRMRELNAKTEISVQIIRTENDRSKARRLSSRCRDM
jgi:hypothetical protein